MINTIIMYIMVVYDVNKEQEHFQFFSSDSHYQIEFPIIRLYLYYSYLTMGLAAILIEAA